MNVSHSTLSVGAVEREHRHAAPVVARRREEQTIAPDDRRRVAAARHSRLPLHARRRRPRVRVLRLGDEPLRRGAAPLAASTSRPRLRPRRSGRPPVRRTAATPSPAATTSARRTWPDAHLADLAARHRRNPIEFRPMLRALLSAATFVLLLATALVPAQHPPLIRVVPVSAADARRPAEASVAINPTNPDHVIATFIQSSAPGQQPRSSQLAATSRPMAASRGPARRRPTPSGACRATT